MSRTIIDLLEPEIVARTDDSIRIVFGVKPEFRIPSGVVQGGIVTAMLDMAMALAGGGGISTASLHVEILRPVRGPKLVVSGEIVRRGRRIVFAEAEMCDEAGEVLARGRQTAVPPTPSDDPRSSPA